MSLRSFNWFIAGVFVGGGGGYVAGMAHAFFLAVHPR